jgi:hypothetical protein
MSSQPWRCLSPVRRAPCPGGCQKLHILLARLGRDAVSSRQPPAPGSLATHVPPASALVWVILPTYMIPEDRSSSVHEEHVEGLGLAVVSDVHGALVGHGVAAQRGRT